jgi:hypothetical protein
MNHVKFLTALIGFGLFCCAQDAPTVQIKVVKDAPFSAQAITESTQVLEDGNHITHKTTAAIARDSDGRTRREQILLGGTSIAFIHDSVAGVAYAVDSNKKSVHRFSISNADSKAADSATSNGESLGNRRYSGRRNSDHSEARGRCSRQRESATDFDRGLVFN